MFNWCKQSSPDSSYTAIKQSRYGATSIRVLPCFWSCLSTPSNTISVHSLVPLPSLFVAQVVLARTARSTASRLRIIPKRWECVIDVKKNKKKTASRLTYYPEPAAWPWHLALDLLELSCIWTYSICSSPLLLPANLPPNNLLVVRTLEAIRGFSIQHIPSRAPKALGGLRSAEIHACPYGDAMVIGLRWTWVEACTATVYIKNRLLHFAVQNMTPFEAFYNKKPSISHL